MIEASPMLNPDSYPTWREALLSMGGVIVICSVVAWALTERIGAQVKEFLDAQSERDATRDAAFQNFTANQTAIAMQAAETRGATQARMEFMEKAIASVGLDVKRLLERRGPGTEADRP